MSAFINLIGTIVVLVCVTFAAAFGFAYIGAGPTAYAYCDITTVTPIDQMQCMIEYRYN